MTEFLTRCCGASYKVDSKGTVHWYLCSKCGQPTHSHKDEVLNEKEAEMMLLKSEHAVGE
jgi:hypothetical protein